MLKNKKVCVRLDEEMSERLDLASRFCVGPNKKNATVIAALDHILPDLDALREYRDYAKLPGWRRYEVTNPPSKPTLRCKDDE